MRYFSDTNYEIEVSTSAQYRLEKNRFVERITFQFKTDRERHLEKINYPYTWYSIWRGFASLEKYLCKNPTYLYQHLQCKNDK
jgi:hypothetical protein